MLDCAVVHAAMDRFEACARTSEGLRVTTHCLYPAFEQVEVFVVGHGDGFIVHDGGGAARTAWLHGAADRAVNGSLTAAAAGFGCEVKDRSIRVEAASADWLWSAIAAVANASSDAARASVGRVRLTKEVGLIAKTKAILDAARWKPQTKLSVPMTGRSGKVHTFDLAVEHEGRLALIDAVVPHPASIAAKFMSFADTESQDRLYKYALYDGDLSSEDKTLISGVAELVSFKAIQGGDGRFLVQ